MVKKEDFVFTVGYQGDTAIVNGELKLKYGRYSCLDLAQEGLFKPAICSALYDKDLEGLNKILDLYNTKVSKRLISVEDLKKTFGVTGIPEGITKVSII